MNQLVEDEKPAVTEKGKVQSSYRNTGPLFQMHLEHIHNNALRCSPEKWHKGSVCEEGRQTAFKHPPTCHITLWSGRHCQTVFWKFKRPPPPLQKSTLPFQWQQPVINGTMHTWHMSVHCYRKTAGDDWTYLHDAVSQETIVYTYILCAVNLVYVNDAYATLLIHFTVMQQNPYHKQRCHSSIAVTKILLGEKCSQCSAERLDPETMCEMLDKLLISSMFLKSLHSSEGMNIVYIIFWINTSYIFFIWWYGIFFIILYLHFKKRPASQLIIT